MVDKVSRFWEEKSLDQMTISEWESLCDGCAKCCLHKLEDEETGEVFYTDIACRYLDEHTCRCTEYDTRKQRVSACIQLQPKEVASFDWLPTTCSYRLLAEGQPLPLWHPLLSACTDSVHSRGISVRGRVVSERKVDREDYEERIIYWAN